MDKALIQKYNVPVPRYTSYPPANHFKALSSQEYLDEVRQSNHYSRNNISFYIHVPFCQQLCHYCGCNSVAMASDERVSAYVEALHKEIDLLLPLLNKNRKISQIHYGGGSPTSLPVSVIRELNDHLLQGFDTIEQPEIAIECQPAYLTASDWNELTDAHFTRMSIGVQDFAPDVLKAVNRKPSLIPLEEVFDILSSKGIRVNLDFIYGLPLQTVDSFAQTIERAIRLRPHRLVTFSYAHVPWVNKRQLILEKYGLPKEDDKTAMFQKATDLLLAAGYQPVGMDHFVLPDDSLYQALKDHQLHRNFQGYCTRAITAQVYAFGVSGISQLDGMYAQNTKNIDEYLQNVNEGILPIVKGYALNKEEQVTRSVIEMLMCNYQIDWNELTQLLNMTISDIKKATAYDEVKMADFARDGLIQMDEQRIVMQPEYAPFVRNVAASLDRLMSNATPNFSKPI